MNISSRLFGYTSTALPVTLFRLENSSGAYAEVLDYGATLHAVVVPDRRGVLTDVCLGFDSVEEYEKNGGFIGATIGRCANRIRGSRFMMDGTLYLLTSNDGRNHLHGGAQGFDKQIWHHYVDDNCVVFFRCSPDGEACYPGEVQTKISYTFSEDNCLKISISAVTDKPTPVNVTNHAYWNLCGHGSGNISKHELCIYADAITPLAEDCCPNGDILSVVNSPFDFRKPYPLGARWDDNHPQLHIGHGYDHNWVLSGNGLREVAILRAPESGIAMHLYTTQPGLQVYTANTFNTMKGKGGVCYGPRQAIALEAQGFPNAINIPSFPSVVLYPSEQYNHDIFFHFFCDDATDVH